ncbi:MAG: XdhC family protein [Alphaproteobacteria bacterium]|jgi:xanthine dehydrogenase accessory factor|nr:XdhC family protein [Alphaproteobacteria bacterium]
MQQATLSQILDDRAARRPVVLATNLESGDEKILYPIDGDEQSDLVTEAAAAIHADKSRTVETAEGPVFLHVFNPPLRMILIGAVHISQPLARMAALAGYEVVVVDPRRAFASAARFPGVEVRTDWPDEALEDLAPNLRTAVVTLTHDPKLDDPALHVALRSDAFYIGSLGSKKTHRTRVERLTEAGFDENTIGRILGPVGLSIGATSPAEIAVAILAQITDVLRHQGA